MDGMNSSRWKWLDDLLSQQQGKVSCVYRNLVTGESYVYAGDAVHPSASVIKTFLMAYVFQLIEDGKLTAAQQIPIRKEDMAISCGVLNYLKDVASLSVRDLTELMMIISDNAATNVLLSLVGMENMERYLKEDLKLKATSFQRRMMDLEAIAKGIQNYTSAEEVADLLEKIYRGEMVSKDASALMLQILKEQQFDDLIPAYLSEIIPEYSIAHKSGGLDGVVHDAGIVDYGKEPFILCLFGSELPSTKPFGNAIGEIALRIYQMLQE